MSLSLMLSNNLKCLCFVERAKNTTQYNAMHMLSNATTHELPYAPMQSSMAHGSEMLNFTSANKSLPTLVNTAQHMEKGITAPALTYRHTPACTAQPTAQNALLCKMQHTTPSRNKRAVTNPYPKLSLLEFPGQHTSMHISSSPSRCTMQILLRTVIRAPSCC